LAPQLLILRLVSEHKSLPSTWSGGSDCSSSLREADILYRKLPALFRIGHSWAARARS
jgi:hypothetical protein